MKRRTLVRALIGLGIGIPILVEGVTFLGLVESRLFGGDGDESSEPTPTRAVGVGDELLPGTPQAETVTEAIVRAGEDWEFRMTVEVENTGDADYRLRLGEVRLDGDATAAGGGGTGRLAPGASETFTGRWEIPQGSTPTSVEAVATAYADGEEAGGETVARERVPLAAVPVRRA